MKKEFWRKEDVAALLGVTSRTVDNEVSRGRITPTRFGRQVRFADAEVQAYLQRARVA